MRSKHADMLASHQGSMPHSQMSAAGFSVSDPYCVGEEVHNAMRDSHTEPVPPEFQLDSVKPAAM